MGDVGVGCVFQHRRVEMAVIPLNELADAAHFQIINLALELLFLMQNFQCTSQELIASF
jgi:hypothetical protein